MKVSDFEFIAQLLKERSGLVLTRDKSYLLERRLNPVARRHNFRGFDELAEALRLGTDQELLRDVTESMTTNESSFFRDKRPFDQFRNLVLPHLLESRGKNRSIRIWSAGCSSGQEPYSVAMILKENEAALAGWNIKIIATDLSEAMLEKAKRGEYSQFEVQRGLPIQLLVKYFKQQDGLWQIDPSIRQMVTFQAFNLLDDPTLLGRFDVIFCRNVLIYFNQATKTTVLQRVASLLPVDGFLYLGNTETVLGISDSLQLIPGHRGIYRVDKAEDALQSFVAKAVGLLGRG